MGTKLNLRLAEQHKAVRKRSQAQAEARNRVVLAPVSYEAMRQIHEAIRRSEPGAIIWIDD